MKRYHFYYSKEKRSIWSDDLDEINRYICLDVDLPVGGLRVTDIRPEIRKDETTIIFMVSYSDDGCLNIRQEIVKRKVKKEESKLAEEFQKSCTVSKRKYHESAVKLCTNPGCTEAEKFNCGRCERITYCSKQCQRLDWKRHKLTCFLIGLN